LARSGGGGGGGSEGGALFLSTAGAEGVLQEDKIGEDEEDAQH